MRRLLVTPTSFLAACALVLFASCLGGSPSRAEQLEEWWGKAPIPDADVSIAPDGVTPLPEGTHPVLRATFTKYTRLTTPDGGALHVLATEGVAEELVARVREILRFYLTDVPGTRFGADKRAVANAMAERRAALLVFESSRAAIRAMRGPLGEAPLFVQELYADEMVLEGSRAYFSGEVRDRTLGDVFELVHAAGIRWALPEYHAVLEEAARDAVRAGTWRTDPDWVLERASSIEYARWLVETSWGLWADAAPDDLRDERAIRTPRELAADDPRGLAALRMFLPARLAFEVRLAPELRGEFVLRRDPDLAYTQRSRHLANVRLTGVAAAKLVGSDLDDRLAGNPNDNRIEGGAGHDVAVFRGLADQYETARSDDGVLVSDTVPGRDGNDWLVGVECVAFADRTVAVDSDAGAACATGHPDFGLGAAFGSGRPAASLRRPAGSPPEFEMDLEEHLDGVLADLRDFFDADGDGLLARAELPSEFHAMLEFADVDRDDAASEDELRRALRRALEGASYVRIDPEEEVERVFESLDENGDGRITREELPEELLEGFDRVDANGDGAIQPEELLPTFGGTP